MQGFFDWIEKENAEVVTVGMSANIEVTIKHICSALLSINYTWMVDCFLRRIRL